MTNNQNLAPHSQEAEESVLGSILINSDAFWEVFTFLLPEDFFLLRNQWVYEACIALVSRNEIIEYLTVVEELKAKGRLQDIGGMAYITYLIGNTPTSVYAEAYGRIVQAAAVRRRCLEMAEKINVLALSEDIAVDKVISQIEALVYQTLAFRTGADLHPLALVDEVLQTAFARHDGIEVADVIKTGWKIDKFLTGGGFNEGLVIVSSGTSGGKTMWMLNMAYAAVLQGFTTGTFHLEMNEAAVIRRWIGALARVNTKHLVDGQFSPDKRVDIENAALIVNSVKHLLQVDGERNQTVYQIMTKIRNAHRNSGLRIAFVDYAGLISTEGLKNQKRHDLELGEISRNLQGLALDLHIPIVLGAQQQRMGGGLKNIAESYKIAQDSDYFIYIENWDAQEEETKHIRRDMVPKRVTVEKQRDGEAGAWAFTKQYFYMPYQLVEDVQEVDLPF